MGPLVRFGAATVTAFEVIGFEERIGQARSGDAARTSGGNAAADAEALYLMVQQRW